jgi:hypothetical protein
VPVAVVAPAKPAVVKPPGEVPVSIVSPPVAAGLTSRELVAAGLGAGAVAALVLVIWLLTRLF